MALQVFEKLAGVPTNYDRDNSQQYGTRGRKAKFSAEKSFIRELETCFEKLWEVSGFGPADVITSAGAFVDHGGGGHHPTGTAFDLDGIFWQNVSFVTLFDGFRGRNVSLYYGVEAHLRQHFGQVLNFDYNADHRDHFHIDIGREVGFSESSRALTVFVQGVAQRIYKKDIGPTSIDGQYGDDTDRAVSSILKDLGITGKLTTKATWLQFLRQTTLVCFKKNSLLSNANDERTPLQLLHHVYSEIFDNLRNSEDRKRTESALNNFSNHPDVQEFLKKYR